MERICDNRSAGVIIENGLGETLLLNRAKFPYGLAPPAGHIDEHGSFEDAAVTEVAEEVGLHIPIRALELVIDQRRIDNTCRRPNGDFHVWNVYKAVSLETGIDASIDETLGAQWYSRELLQTIALNTRHAIGTVAIGSQVLESTWLDIFEELGIIK